MPCDPCTDIRFDRRKLCLWVLFCTVFCGMGLFILFHDMLHDAFFPIIVTVVSLVAGAMVWVGGATLNISVTRDGIEQFHFGETTTLKWDEMTRILWGGMVYIIYGKSLMSYVIFPVLFWVADQESVKRCIQQYAPEDSPIRKRYNV